MKAKKMRDDITGSQFYYMAHENKALEFLDDGQVCHICGGPLTVNHTPHKTSSSWTAEAECVAKESEFVCEACKWCNTKPKEAKEATEDAPAQEAKPGGYTSLWKADEEGCKNVVVITKNGVFHPHFQEFLDMLKDKKNYPGIFAVSYDENRSRKNSELFATRSISYDRENCHIWFTGLADKKMTTLSGCVTINATEFAKEATKIAKAVKECIDPFYTPSEKSTAPDKARRTNALCTLSWLRENRNTEEGGALTYSDAEYLRDFVACSVAENL